MHKKTRLIVQLELYRVHTPCTPCICIVVQCTWTYAVDDLYLCGQSCAWAERTWSCCIVGTVDGHGYDCQQKYTNCCACRLYHSILSILKPIFVKFDRFAGLQHAQVPRSSDFGNFCVHNDNNDNKTDNFTPCACTRGKKYILYSRKIWRFGGLPSQPPN